MEKLPRMREDIELLPMAHAGRQMVLVRDPLGLIREPIALNQAAAALLTMLDGTHTMSDLKLFLARQQGGVLVTDIELEQMLGQLGAFCLLQDERYERARAEIVSAYAAKPVRAAHHAGLTYPVNAEDLRLMLEEVLALADHAALPDGEYVAAQREAADTSDRRSSLEAGGGRGLPAGPGAPAEVTPESLRDHVVALVAPHMDLRPAAKCYAAAYSPMRGAEVDLAIILGTGHSVRSNTFSLTTKDFETPLGRAVTEKSMVERLLSVPGDCVLDNDLPHRHEHSIEFQVIFLQHVLNKPDLHILPVLCGSYRNSLDSYGRPSEIPCVGDFLAELRAIIEGEGRRCLVVAGVDFSHVGMKFGDSYSGRTLAQDATRHDVALIERLCAWDVLGFWQESRRVKDMYKVCGFSPMASMLEILPAAEGHFLGYDVSFEDATHSAVSYAAVAFTRA